MRITAKILSAAVFTGLLVLLPSGCSSVVGIAPSTTPLTEADSYTIIGPTSGTSSGVVWFFIPTFPDNPSKTARDNAIKSRHADALIEVTEEYNVFSILLMSFVWTTVEGTAIKIKRGGRLDTD